MSNDNPWKLFSPINLMAKISFYLVGLSPETGLYILSLMPAVLIVEYVELVNGNLQKKFFQPRFYIYALRVTA